MARPPLERLCESLQQTADDERQRLARALHDSAAQTLSAAAMSLSLVETEAASLSPAGQRALAQAQALAATCARELREVSAALFPAMLAEAGLGPALRALGVKLQPRVSLTLGALGRLAPEREVAAYRLVEEALRALYDDGAPVRGSVGPGPRGALVIALEGRGRKGGAALVELALRQRARAAGGRLRLRRVGTRLALTAAFPGR